MQNTRLNTLIAGVSQQINQELRNPWRRISILVVALLFGIYLGVSFSAIAGQMAYLDVYVAALTVLFTELVSWLFYGGRWQLRRSIWGEALNALKLGLLYGLCLIAFMLGS